MGRIEGSSPRPKAQSLDAVEAKITTDDKIAVLAKEVDEIAESLNVLGIATATLLEWKRELEEFKEEFHKLNS